VRSAGQAGRGLRRVEGGFQAYARLSVEPADVLVAALNEEAIMEDEDSEGEVALCAGRGVRGVTVERAVASDAGKPVEGA